MINKLNEVNRIKNYETIVFDIYADNGKKFCECRRTDSNAVLSTKQGDICLTDFIEQIFNNKSKLHKSKKVIYTSKDII